MKVSVCQGLYVNLGSLVLEPVLLPQTISYVTSGYDSILLILKTQYMNSINFQIENYQPIKCLYRLLGICHNIQLYIGQKLGYMHPIFYSSF